MSGSSIKLGNNTTNGNSHNSDYSLRSNPASHNNQKNNNHNNMSSANVPPARSGPAGSISRFNLLTSNPTGGHRTTTVNSRALGGSSNPRDELMVHRYIMNDPGMGVLPMCKPTNNDISIYPDFAPWHKTSIEDEIAFNHLQKGYSEPPHVFNETASARTSIYPMLKGKSNISALSYFMIQSMNTRDKKNRILSNSTFKPPPRVTLTDQKREAWLRDLATPSVSLRRLSRTIPHGLRNRVLLEQCCNKAIPITRAVWLVRCVGANELRALKRKGHNSGPSASSSSIASSSSTVGVAATSESSWLHDWTEQVTDFIYKITNDCIIASNSNLTNSPSICWTKMEYILGLSVHLFSENLLDIRLFLQWCLKFLEESSLDQIPLSLLFIRIFWNEFYSQNYSKQLAEILLHQYCKLSQPAITHHSAITPIKVRISQYTQHLFILSPDSFVIPTQWVTLGNYFNEALDLHNMAPDLAIHDLAKSIRFRNEALMVHDVPVIRASRNKTRALINKLNDISAPRSLDLATISVNLLESTRLNVAAVFKTVFEWAVLYNSIGMERVFICVGLVRCWNEQRRGVSEAFHTFVDSLDIALPENNDNTNSENYFTIKTLEYLYELIAQLLNIRVFSLSLYFRRLIASGLLFIPRLKHKAQLHILILSNLPIKGYFPEFTNQQRMLLNSVPSFDHDQDLKLEQAKNLIKAKLPSLFNSHKSDTSKIHAGIGMETAMAVDMNPDVDVRPEESVFNINNRNSPRNGFPILKAEETKLLSSLFKGTKITLSQWLLDIYTKRLNASGESAGTIFLSVSEFAILQAIFENLQCLMAFYLSLKSTLTSKQSMQSFLLYYIAQTVRHYFQLFATFDDVSELIESMFNKFKLLDGHLENKPKTKKPIPLGVRKLLHFAFQNICEIKPKLGQEIVNLLHQPTQLNPATNLSAFISSRAIVTLADLLGDNYPISHGNGFVPSLSPMSEVNTNNVPNDINYAQIDQIPFTDIFDHVTNKFLTCCKDRNETNTARQLVALLQELRDFNEECFDDLIAKWLRDHVEPILYFDLASFSRVILFLIIYECILITKVADIFLQLRNIRLPGSTVSNQFILSLMSDNDSYVEFLTLKPWESSLLMYLRTIFSFGNSNYYGNDGAKIYLRYILQEILDSSTQVPQAQQTQQTQQDQPQLLVSYHMVEFLARLTTVNFDLFLENLIKPILDSENYQSINAFHQILLRILQLPASISLSPKTDILNLTKSLNDFTLPVFQFDLRLLFILYKIERESQNQLHGEDGFPTLDIDIMIDQGPGQPVTAPTPVFLNSVTHPNEEDRLESRNTNLGRSTVKSEPDVSAAANKLDAKQNNEIEVGFANKVFECIWELSTSELVSANFRRLFADLLVYLPQKLKGEILVGAEIRFLHSSNFPRVLFNEDPGLDLSSTTTNTAIETTKTVSPSSSNIVPLLLELVDAVADSSTFDIFTVRPFAITTALEKLIFIAENTVFKENTGSWQYCEPDTMSNHGINTNGSISFKSDHNGGINTGGLLTIDEANETNEVYHNNDAEIIDASKEQPDQVKDNGEDEEKVKPSFSSIIKDDIHDGLMLFAKIIMIHRSSFTVKADQPISLRDQIINGLEILLELPFVDAFAELYGLLSDTLNAIKAEISDNSYNNMAMNNGHQHTMRNGTSNSQTTDIGDVSSVSPQFLTHARARTLSSSSLSSSTRAQVKHTINGASNSSSGTDGFRCQSDHDSYLADLMVFNKASGTFADLNVRSFDLLEESNPTISINDVAINLALFGCTIDKRNPN
ncbi:hypothetical protein NADFUDRAFT_48501 [Nadsonia fulvescens var. elongata DSM 6958]|uniref:Mediator of RNA polymerase II transcription subunit 12 n=1 Tax=Nadsonia fulvescens var. elongata DSM 6958 TaxID=857566 RepID=A0A1E3PQY2_9ASCO|nr:hypothetical protein NADFUDRAFT_48501 [Nadsonia fulvescens var. elongata DSM 6958]